MSSRYVLLLLAAACLLPAAATAEVPIVDTWKYTQRRPAQGWQQPGFDDSGWREGPGGFGTRETPGARVGTDWQSDRIWLRKSFKLDSVPEKPALLIHHDEDTVVFINGTQVAELDGYITDYKLVSIGDSRAVLKEGQNVMAVHCRQTGGGQFIDVHLVDADKVPQLPPPQRNTEPFKSDLVTTWGAEVTADNAWTEYPRPQLVRDDWQNLNGRWRYTITPRQQQKMPEQWDGQIIVPFPLESKLSGVQRLLDPTETLWYRRTFHAEPQSGERTLLNFEAVDYRCDVYVNGDRVGSHQGGNVPFSFDVSDSLQDGDNELVVRVDDDTEAWQLRGKQVLNPRGIWYTRVSGIWQTVWLEQVNAEHIEDLVIHTDPENGAITVQPQVTGGATVEIVVKDGDMVVARVSGDARQSHSLAVERAKLWSPASPHLYGVEIALLDGEGRQIDRVESYAGIRSVGKQRGEDGHWRFTLNGEQIFHWGPLDQGWWPDGLLTPPSDEAMLFEIEFLKAAGFNMIRKHIKVEPRRYYYHCDRLGMMVWQDQVSAGNNPPWTRLQPDPEDANWPDDQHEQFMVEFERMIDTLENHPSIVVWVPFNEAWGQHRTVAVGEWTVKRDPSRLVNIASGGNFWPVGDIVDHHSYPHPDFPFDPERFDGFIKVIGEFGGHGYPVQGHLWDPDRRNWGYGGLPKDKAEYKQRYVTSLDLLNQFRGRGIAGGIYTQTTDVEGEINGLMTYDRKVIKIPAKELARLHQRLFQPAPDSDDSKAEARKSPANQ